MISVKFNGKFKFLLDALLENFDFSFRFDSNSTGRRWSAYYQVLREDIVQFWSVGNIATVP